MCGDMCVCVLKPDWNLLSSVGQNVGQGEHRFCVSVWQSGQFLSLLAKFCLKTESHRELFLIVG